MHMASGQIVKSISASTGGSVSSKICLPVPVCKCHHDVERCEEKDEVEEAVAVSNSISLIISWVPASMLHVTVPSCVHTTAEFELKWKAQLSLRKVDRTAYVWRPVSDFWSQRKSSSTDVNVNTALKCYNQCKYNSDHLMGQYIVLMIKKYRPFKGMGSCQGSSLSTVG